jgi:ABC-type Fe3+ transport system substrate-binding protein
LYSPLLQTAAIIKTSQHPDAAARFVQALTSAEAQSTFRRYGYASPPKDTP